MKKQNQFFPRKIILLEINDYNHFRYYLRYLIILLAIISTSSCYQNRSFSDAEGIVTKWMGKTINLPLDVRCTYMGRDTVYTDVNTPYKVVVYTDSIGCLSCKLQLYKWNSLIKEADALMPNKVSFLFYFYPKNEQELQALLRKNDFKRNVFIDNEGKLNATNNLPDNMRYQCLLLGKDNEVVLIGNPTTNPNIWNLYKQAITGEKHIEQDNVNITTVQIEKKEVELKGLKIHETVTGTFVLENTGTVPLFIKDITASCGCTVPKWDKKIVMPGSKTEIKIKVTLGTSGFFRKTVTVLCNVKKGFILLTIKGTVTN